jgi:hypothetical protein
MAGSASQLGSTGWQKVVDRIVKIERRVRELERPSAAQIQGTSGAVNRLREDIVTVDGSKLYTKAEVDELLKTANAEISAQELRIAELERLIVLPAEDASGA